MQPFALQLECSGGFGGGGGATAITSPSISSSANGVFPETQKMAVMLGAMAAGGAMNHSFGNEKSTRMWVGGRG
eukprot:CAMPEP_0174312260 /NCGR_PEP_ID=MMETSP0810-20121108/4183_1 /TAXON_ID=73025 ORGANISM="Eutreptiella gymnastica-like, Strain CCMP1594" /NCGR_SAMPLE_ID=MMETSP0810 /ASSEMBLY_ACC=CAM_ASM_000659 /LENGTH=73 /DNA_ID=CAMNT_0015420617 /DNA_START=62 /DNA_END=283 /DNA_ORIENTATION=-